jgi:phospholipid transport system substrate-binding protein
MKLPVLWVPCVALLTVFIPVAAAAGSPKEQIKDGTDRIIAIVTDPALKGDEKSEARGAKIRAIVDEKFHWAEMTRRAMALHWRYRSAEEKAEVTKLFSDLIANTYRGHVEGYDGQEVVYRGAEVRGKYARVSTEVRDRKVKYPIVYSMKKYDDGWRVYDVSIEGVRLVANYRTQFSEMLDRMTYKQFVAELRKKIENDEPEK